jgi:hypothetical protein
LRVSGKKICRGENFTLKKDVSTIQTILVPLIQKLHFYEEQLTEKERKKESNITGCSGKPIV